jgi:parallel beta-helix repeat protein
LLGPGNRIERNSITASGVGIDLSGSTDSYFAANLLQGNGVAFVGELDDTDGGAVDPALANVVLP